MPRTQLHSLNTRPSNQVGQVDELAVESQIDDWIRARRDVGATQNIARSAFERGVFSIAVDRLDLAQIELSKMFTNEHAAWLQVREPRRRAGHEASVAARCGRLGAGRVCLS